MTGKAAAAVDGEADPALSAILWLLKGALRGRIVNSLLRPQLRCASARRPQGSAAVSHPVAPEGRGLEQAVCARCGRLRPPPSFPVT